MRFNGFAHRMLDDLVEIVEKQKLPNEALAVYFGALYRWFVHYSEIWRILNEDSNPYNKWLQEV